MLVPSVCTVISERNTAHKAQLDIIRLMKIPSIDIKIFSIGKNVYINALFT